MFKDVCFDSGYLCHSETAHLAVNRRYLWNFTSLLGFINSRPSGRGTKERTG